MHLDTARLREELEDILRFLPSYLRNPVEGIRQAPEWSWPSLISVQAGLAMASGVLVGLLSLSFWSFLLGLIIFPVSSLIQTFLISFFLTTYYSVVHSTALDHQRLFGIVVLANIPYLVLHVLSGFVPPIDLIGFAATCGLLIVGLHEHFRIERRQLFRLIGGVYAVFLIIWAVSQYRSVQNAEHLDQLAAPKALDALEREMKKD